MPGAMARARAGEAVPSAGHDGLSIGRLWQIFSLPRCSLAKLKLRKAVQFLLDAPLPFAARPFSDPRPFLHQ